MNILINLLTGPWLIAVIGVFFVVCIATWKVAVWKTTTDIRINSLEEAVEKILNKLDRIFIMLVNRYGEHQVEQSASPVGLNGYGKKLAKQIDAGKIVEHYSGRADKETQNMNAYQIQEFCSIFSNNVILKELEKDDKPRFDKLSEVAFNEGILIEKIARVLGILLRDRVLQIRGISHADVDVSTAE